MAFDMNNFVIDRVVRGVALAQGANANLGIQAGDILFSINQITNPSLSCTSESADAVDAMGTPIATFYRAKSAEFSAENALFDMNLMATQVGSKKVVASSSKVVLVPAFETVDVAASATTATLANTPKDTAAVKCYELNGDGTLGAKIDVTVSGTTATFAADSSNERQLFFMYEWESKGAENKGAIEVVNSAVNFPVGCKFIMEILGADVCDQTNLVYAYLIFPNAKLSPDFDWSIATDSTHPFSMKAMQDYCDKEKKLFSIVIPE